MNTKPSNKEWHLKKKKTKGAYNTYNIMVQIIIFLDWNNYMAIYVRTIPIINIMSVERYNINEKKYNTAFKKLIKDSTRSPLINNCF
jgi:hypothetical protein